MGSQRLAGDSRTKPFVVSQFTAHYMHRLSLEMYDN